MKKAKNARSAGLVAGRDPLRECSRCARNRKRWPRRCGQSTCSPEGSGRLSAIPGRERLLHLGRAEHRHGSVSAGEASGGSAATGRFGAGERLDRGPGLGGSRVPRAGRPQARSSARSAAMLERAPRSAPPRERLWDTRAETRRRPRPSSRSRSSRPPTGEATAQQMGNFKKAFSVCLEAKHYLVKY